MLNWVCLFTAYGHSSIAVATVVYHVQPFILLLLAAMLGQEAMPVRKLPWLLLALVGVALSSGLLQGGHAASWAGVRWLRPACCRGDPGNPASQAVVCRADRHAADGDGVLALAVPAWQLAASAQFSAKAWAAVAVLGLVHTAWMYTLMYAAFQRLSAQAIAGLSFIYPVVAVLVDLLWFGQHPAPLQALGMVLILLAVWAYRKEKVRCFPAQTFMDRARKAIKIKSGCDGQHQRHQHGRGHAVQAHGQGGKGSGCGLT